MKKTNKITVALFGSCAVIWTIRAVLEVVHQTYRESAFWFGMNVLCAVIWIAAFAVNLIRYRAQKEK